MPLMVLPENDKLGRIWTKALYGDNEDVCQNINNWFRRMGERVTEVIDIKYQYTCDPNYINTENPQQRVPLEAALVIYRGDSDDEGDRRDIDAYQAD